jgi:hypothetical protein
LRFRAQETCSTNADEETKLSWGKGKFTQTTIKLDNHAREVAVMMTKPRVKK